MVEAANLMEPETRIAIRGLRKSYGKQLAVDGIDFEIKKGEAFGLLGPNGAGKSTTIHMIVGLLHPDEGAVTIGDGIDASSFAAKQNFGIAPQNLSLYEELTTKENLRFFGKLYGMSTQSLRERTSWALDFSGLEDQKNRRVKTLSGGMKRRLNLAVALLHQPSIVLLDEPTVGVDPQSRNHLLEAISKLKEEGLTILYTTHYMEEAERLCDRIAIIDHGKILALDTVDALIDSYGGTSVVNAEFKQPTPTDIELPGILQGKEHRWESVSPVDDINKLVAQGVGFHGLRITRPDLESVFLALTGRSLRDS